MEMKWTDADFAEYDQGKLPMGKTPPDEWSYGDIEAGFKSARTVAAATLAERYFAGRKDSFRPTKSEETLVATT